MELDKLDKLDRLDKLDTASQQCLLKGMLRWKTICSKGLEGSICSIGWTYFSAMSPERDVALEEDLFKRFGRFNLFNRLGHTVLTSQQCLLKGMLRWKKICSKGWTYFSAMSPERDVAFLIGLMFKTLRWFKGLSRFAGLLLLGMCSKMWKVQFAQKVNAIY